MAKGRRGNRGGRGRRKLTPAREPQGGGLAVPPAGGLSLPGAMNLSGWDGSRRSERRGYVVWPTLDSRKELGAHDRIEIMRKVRAGEANIGLVKRCIHGVSDLVGYLRPQAATADPDFNRRAEDAFMRRASQPLAFDMAGRLDFFAWQSVIKKARLRDGDGLTVLAEGSEGGGRVMFYEAHQIGDGRGEARGERPANLFDGVFLDRWGGRVAFRVTSPEGDKWKRVDRERAIYHGHCDRVGRPREVSGVAHAVSNFLDMVEILADTKHAVKVAAMWGVALESEAGNNGGAMGSALQAYLNGDETVGGDLGGVGETLTLEKILQGGKMQALPGGSKLTTLQDTRPHPNQMALLAWLVRDMAWGCKVAPEVLWDVSGLNGTATRYLMADTRRFVENEQRELERECQRVWMYFLAKERQAGRLEIPAGLDHWWRARWIPQADMTIDRGREGKLEMELVEKRLQTRADYWGRQGKDWEEQERQLLVEELRMEQMRAEVLEG